MVRDDLAGTPDAGTLRVTAGGLSIMRRRKHEHGAQLGPVSRAKAARRTGKVVGSKFNEHWPLVRIVNFIEDQVGALGWHYPPNLKQSVELRQAQAVGVSDGEIVHTVRIVREGRYVHAYPVED